MDFENSESQDVATHHEDYLETENNCCLCGTPLVFEHEIDPYDQKVKEKASCPACKVQLKDREHPLH